MNNIITSAEILKITNLKPSQLAYLTREGIIPCYRRGKGIPVLYPAIVIEIIKTRQKAITGHSDIDSED